MNQIDILLVTLNSTYQHSSFGLRYLYANMQELQSRTRILESTIKENPRSLVEKILAFRPRIVGLSLYIWNTAESLEVIMVLKKVVPEITIVLGGPEISYETEKQEHLKWCDYVIKGEADFSFRELCKQILVTGTPPEQKVIAAELPEIKSLQLPYHLYSDDDIKNRVIYVEASRGCPYKCEYCLSSLDKSVRSFDLDLFLNEMQLLLGRGVRIFKFVDRTFNLSPTTSTRILNFFLERMLEFPEMFLHFELVPDRLPVEIRELIARFPAGSLQFEIGIQTLNPAVAQNVSRKNDLAKVAENFSYLREHTLVHTHADLIVGLPGESLESFAAGFDRLSAMGPDEIQVGILKRLRGTPIARHETAYKMLYSESSPYQILSTANMDYVTLQKMNRFAKFWDLYANSGDFKNFMKWLRGVPVAGSGLFERFFAFSEYLSAVYSETHSIALVKLAEKAWNFMQEHGISAEEASTIIEKDYCFGPKRRDFPVFLKPINAKTPLVRASSSLNNRQMRHLQN